MKRCTYKR